MAKKEYTDEEKARFAKYEERKKRKPVKFKIVKGDSDKPQVTFEDPDDSLHNVKMSEALGAAYSYLQTYLLEQVMGTFREISADGAGTEAVEATANRAMALLSGIQPQDELEAMLAVQMIGVHNIAMDCIGKATRTERVNFMSTYMNGATKSLLTFAAQMEALKKYRSGGQQKIVVKHVHVNEGGQAIVGTVNPGGGGIK